MTDSLRRETAEPVIAADRAATLKKVAIRLAPLLFLCYIAAYVDRTNIGFAKAQLQSDLGFSDAVYGLGAGLFFVAYFLFEVPSNLIMMRIGARATISRIMILWGLVSVAMMFVTNPATFYILRFLLGAAEAGFAPAVILYLTFWFPEAWRARMLSLFLVAVPVSGILGGPLAGWLLTSLDERGGLHGWQWLFIAEGILPVVIGLVVMRALTNRPAEAGWLTAGEKAQVEQALAEDPRSAGGHRVRLADAVRDWRTWVLSFVYFTISAGIFLIAFWLPTILEDFGDLSDLQVGFLYAIPYVAALVAMLIVSLHSDRTLERGWHLAACGVVSAVAFLISITAGNVWVAILVFSVAAAGVISMMPVFWTLPSMVFGGAAAAGGIAIINSIGTLAGFVSPYYAALVKEHTGSTAGAVVTIGILLLIGSGTGFWLAKRLARTGAA
jgi:MFS family permease